VALPAAPLVVCRPVARTSRKRCNLPKLGICRLSDECPYAENPV
jgi:hypothetical protein